MKGLSDKRLICPGKLQSKFCLNICQMDNNSQKYCEISKQKKVKSGRFYELQEWFYRLLAIWNITRLNIMSTVPV